MIRRYLISFLVLIVIALGIFVLIRVTDRSDDANAIKNPDSLVYISVMDPVSTLDPAWAYDSGSGYIIFNIYDTLIFFDGAHPDTFIPMLAESVPSIENGLIQDGGTTYIFPIRDGPTFHYGPIEDENGNTIPGSGVLSPEDVTYSFHRALLQDRTGGPAQLLLEPLLGVNSVLDLAIQMESIGGETRSIQNLEDVSPETLIELCQRVKGTVTNDGEAVTFHLRTPFAPFLQIIAGYWASILDREFAISEIADDESGFSKSAGWDGSCTTWQDFYDPLQEEDQLFDIANGTGPYKLKRWVKEEEILLVRNDDYWGERPAHIENIVLRFQSEWIPRLLALQAGDADIIQVEPPNQDQVVPLIEAGLVDRYENLPTSTLRFWKFNQDINMTANQYVGSGQLDGEGIPSDFFRDRDVRRGFANAFDYETYLQDIVGGEGNRAYSFMHSTIASFNPDQTSYDLNLAEAEFSLRQAFDGALWDTGFTLYLPYPAGNALVRNSGELLSTNLELLNPKFKVIVQDFQGSQIFADDRLGRVPLNFSGWHEDFHDAHNWAFPFLHSNSYFSEGMNIEPVLQLQLDDLIDRALTTQDSQKRTELYHELQRLAHEEALLIPVDEYLRKRYVRSWLSDYVHNPAFPGIYFWYIKKGDDLN